MISKILQNKYPRLANFGTRNLAELGSSAQFFWVHFQKLCGLS